MEEKESRNLFIYDYPIGRKRYLINLAIILGVYFLFVFALVFVMAHVKVYSALRYVLPVCSLILNLTFLYCGIINMAKRLYDIIGEKGKSLLYVILINVASFGMMFYGKLMILWLVLTFIFGIFLLVKKGGLVLKTVEDGDSANENA